MNFFKFGFIDFFGILAPGVIFLFNVLALIYAILSTGQWGNYILGLFNLSEFSSTCEEIGSGWIVFSIFLLIVCYLFGFILRLLRPDFVDTITTIFLKICARWKYGREKSELRKEHADLKAGKSGKTIPEDFNEYLEKNYYPEMVKGMRKFPSFLWLEEKFPYYWYIKYNYCNKFPTLVFPEMVDSKDHFNTNTYNYYKLFLSCKNLEFSAMIYQTEAYIRFICGSFWALVTGFLAGVIIFVRCLANWLLFSSMNYVRFELAAMMLAVTGIMLVIIMLRFKNQRKREVKMVIDGVIITAENTKDLKIFDGMQNRPE